MQLDRPEPMYDRERAHSFTAESGRALGATRSHILSAACFEWSIFSKTVTMAWNNDYSAHAYAPDIASVLSSLDNHTHTAQVSFLWPRTSTTCRRRDAHWTFGAQALKPRFDGCCLIVFCRHCPPASSPSFSQRSGRTMVEAPSSRSLR